MGDPLDDRADVYAVGVLMYELFTGQLPFYGPNAVTVIYKQMEEDPTPPGKLSNDIPEPLEKIILKAMNKDPGQRYPSAQLMRIEIEAILEGRPIESEFKGDSESLTAEKKPGSKEKGGGRFECRLVGREDEVNALKASFDIRKEDQKSVVLISGEAGIGKTRLAVEALDYARRKGFLTLQGSCLFTEGPEPYLPFIEAIGQYLESRDEGEHQRLDKFFREEAPELKDLIPRFMTMIRTRRTMGLIHPDETIATSRERLFEAITQVLLFLSRGTPVCLLLEDLQWADSGSLQLLYYIGRTAKPQSLIILGTFRIEDLIPDTDGTPHSLLETMQRMSREEIFRKIELKGLGFEATNLLVRFMFRRNMFSAGFRASLYKETGGNPLFIIEVLKLLRDDGVISDRKGIWRERREITSGDIPERVYDVVVRRVERLNEDDRELLQIAAVAGDKFTSQALTNVSEMKRLHVLKALNRLERAHQLIGSEGEAYGFTHPKTREVLYEEISPELRREYHLAYGTYLEGGSVGKKRELVVDLARHFYYGGAFKKATPYLIRAGDRAGGVFAYPEARNFFEWALETLGDGDSDKRNSLECSLHYRLGDIYNRLGDIQKGLSHLKISEDLAKQKDDFRMEAQVQQRMGHIYFRSGGYDRATERYEKSADNFRRIDDREALCRVLVDSAKIPFEQGDWKGVKAYYVSALRIARQVGDRSQTAIIYMNSGIMASIQGELDRALHRYGKSRKIFEELKEWRNLARLWLNQGWSLAGRKEWGKAREAYRHALKISKKTRDIFSESECYLNVAEVLLATSDLKGSKRACLKALEIFEKVNDQLCIADVFKTLGQVATVERKWEEGHSYFKKSISVNESLKNLLGAGGAHMEYSRMLKDLGNLDGALAELERSMTCFQTINAKEDLKMAGEIKKEVEALHYLAQP